MSASCHGSSAEYARIAGSLLVATGGADGRFARYRRCTWAAAPNGRPRLPPATALLLTWDPGLRCSWQRRSSGCG